MGSLEAALRDELAVISARRTIIEEALDRLVTLNSDQPEEGSARDHYREHPTLGRITISRDHPRWESTWKAEVERLLNTIRDNPGANNKRLGELTGMTGGHTSALIRFLEAEETIEADQPELRLQGHRPNKTYHVAGEVSLEEAETETKPKHRKAKPARRKGTRRMRYARGETAKRVFDLINQQPGISTTEIRNVLNIPRGGNPHRILTQLEADGRVVRTVNEESGVAHTWHPAVQDPMRPQAPGQEREVKITPGGGAELGRRKLPVHPTLGKMPISRVSPTWETTWRAQTEQVMKLIRENPETPAKQLCKLSGITQSHMFSLLRFLELEEMIEADNPEHRMQQRRPGKTYHVVEEVED